MLHLMIDLLNEDFTSRSLHRDGVVELNLLLSVAIHVFVHELLGGKFEFGK